MKKALLVCYGAGHANMVAPVYKKLRERGGLDATVLALSVAKNTFTERGLPFKTVADYAPLVMDEHAERWGRELADRWHVDSSGLSRRDSEVYLGSSMRDLCAEHGEPEARRRLEASGRAAFLPVNTLDRIVAAERPDVIVATNSPRMERAAVLVGNRRGIPTLNIHDDLGYHKRDYLLSGDAIAVMSPITRDNLVEQGHDASKIVVTGHPAFDAVPEERRTFRRDVLLKKFSLPDSPLVLLGTSQPGRRGEIMDMCPQTHAAVKELGGLHLVVKPHPGEDADAYRAYAAGRAGVTVISGVNIRELLFLSDLLITFASTIMIESVLMNKPLVSYNTTGGPDPLPFIGWGLGVEARTPEELGAAIRTVRGDAAFRRGFEAAREKWFAGSTDGRAAERVVGMIARLAGV